jgi:hypothetical protein
MKSAPRVVVDRKNAAIAVRVDGVARNEPSLDGFVDVRPAASQQQVALSVVAARGAY